MTKFFSKCHLDETFKKIQKHVHFKKPCNKLKNVTSKLKILKSKLENLK